MPHDEQELPYPDMGVEADGGPDGYLVANPNTTTLKGVKLVIPPRVAGATRTRPAARRTQPQVTPILGHAPVIEYKVNWQLVHDEEWDQLQQPDVQELVVPRGIITVDTKRQCRDTMVIGYAGVIAPTCYL